MEPSMLDYRTEYSEFIKRYPKEEIDPEEVGFLIVRMAQYFF